jgi:hypothetical protein
MKKNVTFRAGENCLLSTMSEIVPASEVSVASEVPAASGVSVGCEMLVQYADAGLSVAVQTDGGVRKPLSEWKGGAGKSCANKLDVPDGYELKYMDGTCCSASHAFSDVFFNAKTGKYLVVTDTGHAEYTGHSYDSHYHRVECDNILDVFNELLIYNGHDLNTTGQFYYEMLTSLPDLLKSPFDYNMHELVDITNGFNNIVEHINQKYSSVSAIPWLSATTNPAAVIPSDNLPTTLPTALPAQ